MKRGIAVVVAAVLALLGLSPAAFAAVFQPSPPTITMVGSPDQTVPAHPQFFQLSPKPGESGFTVLDYNDQVTRDTSADPATFDIGITSAAGLSGTYTGDGSYTQYVRARMNVTLSDGTAYTTDWSSWVKVQPGPSTGPAPGPTPNENVALGDSYWSGEGAGNYQNGTNSPGQNVCHRSNAAAAMIDSTLPGMPPKFSFHACSGAVVRDFFVANSTDHKDKKGRPTNATETQPQLAWLSNSTATVTISVGGNDVNFAGVIDYCARRTFWQPSCQQAWGTVVDNAINQLGTGSGNGKDNLPDLYKAVRAKAPNAKVYVIGYPRFFSATNIYSCYTGVPDHFFAPDDIRWINSKVAKLDLLIKQRAEAAGFTFVDMYDALHGHELCTKDPWVNGIHYLDLQESFHPNVKGHKAEAAVLANSLKKSV